MPRVAASEVARVSPWPEPVVRTTRSIPRRMAARAGWRLVLLIADDLSNAVWRVSAAGK